MALDEEFPARVRRALLDRRGAHAHWAGHLSSSALATATAVTALAVARRANGTVAPDDALVANGVRWLVANVNTDGGWGDTPDSVSNISTTALAWAALAFGDGPEVDRAAARAERWVALAAGSVEPPRLAAALAQRYGKDRTFSVPILTMCAIAGRLGPGADAWRLIPQLPFELALAPRRLFGALRLPVVSYALPALISMGLARHRRGSGRPLVRGVRELAARRVLRVLQGLQPAGGGFLEAVPLTSFVAMSLVAAGEHDSPVVRHGVKFLHGAVRADGSWAIDSNLATWVTTLSVNALASSAGGLDVMTLADRGRIRDWLLGQQWRAEHPYTGAAPGGWAWTDLPGGVPDADDTAGALLALAHLAPDDQEVREAATLGVAWLLDLQNRDGGIPTFCRGWGTLPFDRSSTDLTAHALRAWLAWSGSLDPALRRRIDISAGRAVRFLAAAQRGDGAFVPLWFGNQREPREENPVLGTSRVLPGLAAARTGFPESDLLIRRGAGWLLSAQGRDGGWGGGPSVRPSIEETAVAVAGLVSIRTACPDLPVARAIDHGVEWLIGATEGGRRFPAAPVGLYFARLWYSEELYPVIFTAGVGEVSLPARKRPYAPLAAVE